MSKKRESIDDICIKDKFIREGMLYTVEGFPNESFVFVEGLDETYDGYFARNEKLLDEINNCDTDKFWKEWKKTSLKKN